MNRSLFILLATSFVLHSCKIETIDLPVSSETLPEAINIESILKKDGVLYFSGGRDGYGTCYTQNIGENGFAALLSAQECINSAVVQNNTIVFLGDNMFTAVYTPATGKVNSDFSYSYFDQWPKTKSSFRRAINIGDFVVIAAGRDQKNGNIYFSDNFETSRLHIPFQENQGLYDIVAFHSDTAIACGYGTVIKLPIRTIETRQEDALLVDISGEIFTGIDFLNGTLVLCSFNGNIYMSKDNGLSWQQKFNSSKKTRKTLMLNDVIFISSEKLIAVGERGAILYSADEGDNWEQVSYNKSTKLIYIFAQTTNSVLIGGAGGTILKISL